MKKTVEAKERVLEALRKLPVMSYAAQKAGVGRTTVYRWTSEDPEFGEKVTLATREGVDFVNDIAETRLASGVSKGKFQFINYWLGNHHKTTYKKYQPPHWLLVITYTGIVLWAAIHL